METNRAFWKPLAGNENQLKNVHILMALLALRFLPGCISLDVFVLSDFLEGTATLRSDVLDRLAQAIGTTIHLEPTPPTA